MGTIVIAIGAPIALVISCSSTNLPTAGLIDISTIQTDRNGEVSKEITGWDIVVISKVDNLPITGLRNGTEYRFQFNLKAAYVAPDNLPELEIDIDNENIYYSSTFTFVELVAQILTRDFIDSIVVNRNSDVIDSVLGWEIEVVSKVDNLPLTELRNGTEYRFQFSLKASYIAPDNLSEVEIDINNSSIYYSNTFTFVELVAQTLTRDFIDSIVVNRNSDVIGSALGWNIDVISKADNLPITELRSETEYRFQFILESSYIAPDNLTEVEIDINNSSIYYSNTFIFVELVAQTLSKSFIDSIIVNASSEITGLALGWDIEVVKAEKNAAQEYENLSELLLLTEYLLKFTIDSEYIINDEMTPESISDFLTFENSSYYTEIKIYTVVASIIDDSSSIFPNSNGIVLETFIGWYIEVVDNIENEQLIGEFSKDSSTPYVLKFTLKPGYLEPMSTNGLTLNNNGSYYSLSRIYPALMEAELITNAYNIFPNESGVISETFRGWDIQIIESIESDQAIVQLIPNDSYFLKATLLSGYFKGGFDNLWENDNGLNGSYYSNIRTYEVLADAVDTVASIIPNKDATFNKTITGWNIEVIDTIPTNKVLEILNPFDLYRLRFTLLPGYLSLTDPDGLFKATNGAYYTNERVFMFKAIDLSASIVTPTAFNDAVTINSAEASTNQPFAGWEIDIVSSQDSTPLENIDGITLFRVIFVLRSGYIIGSVDTSKFNKVQNSDENYIAYRVMTTFII